MGFTVLMTDAQIANMLEEEGLAKSTRPSNDQIIGMVRRKLVSSTVLRINLYLDDMELPKPSMLQKLW